MLKLLLLLLAVFGLGESLKKKTFLAESSVEKPEVIVDHEEEVLKPAVALKNPCQTHGCPHGRECDINHKGKPVCVCVGECEEQLDPRGKVCSTQNDTYDSACHLDRERCLCKTKSKECADRKRIHAHLDYYGPCRLIPDCEKWEMEALPGRMQSWFFQMMKQMAERTDLTDPARVNEVLKKAERMEKNWVLPVIWKFCELDSHPRNKRVSRRELLPIRGTLKPYEHCMAPFLDSCDSDNDHFISMHEWGSCLGLTEDEIDEWSDQCDELQKLRMSS